MRMLAYNRRIFLAIFLLVLVFTGCIPEKLQWLPDSSGIIFTDKSGSRLVHFDLTRIAKRIVVANTGTNTPMPAMRSDGTKLAVARRERKYTQGSNLVIDTTQIQIYDLKGTLLKVSKPHVVQVKHTSSFSETKTDLSEAGLDWSGPYSKILTKDAIYDCDGDNWTGLDGVEPAQFVLHDCPAIRPDGKGFVAISFPAEKKRAPQTAPKIFFVTWDGWRSEFKNFEELYINIEEHYKKNASDSHGIVTGWEWRGTKLVSGLLEFDTDSSEATLIALSPVLPEIVGDTKALRERHFFPSTGYQICEFSGENGDWRLELQDSKKGRQKVLMSNKNVAGLPREFRPSPDGKHVAVRIGIEPVNIYVFDGNGNVIATVACEK